MSKYSDVWGGSSDAEGMDGSECGYKHYYGCGLCSNSSCEKHPFYVKPSVTDTNPDKNISLEEEILEEILREGK